MNIFLNMLLCLLLPYILSMEVEVGIDGETHIHGTDNIKQLKNYHHSDTATLELNKDVVSRPHPFVKMVPGVRSSTCAAKFRSLSSRKIDMWYVLKLITYSHV